MRLRPRDAWIASGAVLLVALGAVVPLANAPQTQEVEATNLVPPELFYQLVDECQGVVPLSDDQAVLPNWAESDAGADVEQRVWLELYRVDPDDGGLFPAEPTAEQAALLGAANLCLGSYEMESWREPPTFDAFHRNMYYDYIAEALVPCLAARGIDARIPSRAAFATLDPNVWYQSQLVDLDFPVALSAWRSCPPYPAYLDDAGHPVDPVEVLHP
jgi:hypothetical protein